MLNSEDSSLLQQRSALVAHWLVRLDINIAALSEVHFPEQSSLIEHSAGYTLYWSGKLQVERCLSGGGFMINNSIVSRLQSLPLGLSNHTMSLHLSLRDQHHATIISVYAPALQADAVDKLKFYTDLRGLIQKTPSKDSIIILGDFNARVGSDYLAWKDVLGRHGLGNCSDIRHLLLELCAETQMAIANIQFQQKN